WEYGFATKWGELLKEIAPRTVRIGVIYDPANAMQRQLPDLERSLSPAIQSVALSVSSRSDLEDAHRADGSRTEWCPDRFRRSACSGRSRSNNYIGGQIPPAIAIPLSVLHGWGRSDFVWTRPSRSIPGRGELYRPHS